MKSMARIVTYATIKTFPLASFTCTDLGTAADLVVNDLGCLKPEESLNDSIKKSGVTLEDEERI